MFSRSNRVRIVTFTAAKLTDRKIIVSRISSSFYPVNNPTAA